MLNQFPSPVLKYLESFILEKYQPAFLVFDKQGQIIGSGGALSDLGIALDHDKNLTTPIDVLEGLLPLNGDTLMLNNVHMQNNHVVNLHLFPDTTGDWALFIDVTERYENILQLHQKANELNILRSKIERL